MVAHESAGESHQDRCQGRQSRSLRYVPDGGGRNPAQVVRCDHAENRHFASAADGNGNMNTPPDNMRRKPMGKVRPDDSAARFFEASGPTRASSRAEPTVWLAESPEKQRNRRAVVRKGQPYGDNGEYPLNASQRLRLPRSRLWLTLRERTRPRHRSMWALRIQRRTVVQPPASFRL